MKRISEREYEELMKDYQEDLNTTNLIKHLYLLLNNDLIDPFLKVKNNVNQQYALIISTSCLNNKIGFQVVDKNYEAVTEKTYSTLRDIIEASINFLGENYTNFVALG